MKKAILRSGFIVLCIAISVVISLIGLNRKAYALGGLTKISDNVFSYVDVNNASPQNSFGANAGIIVGEDGIVVIDTLTSSKEAKRFLKDIREISDKPIKYAINTHSHVDHTFGNSEFAKLGATIVSQINCRKNMEIKSEGALKNAKDYGFAEEDMRGTEIAYPALTFQDRMEIDMGGQKIKLIYFGPSHTNGSIMVYLPDKKILFTGDILFTKFHPFMGDGNIKGWTRTLDYIVSLDVETIIPGHGPVSSKKDIADMKDYLIAFDKKARELASKSSDVEYIVTEIMKSLPIKPEGGNLIRWNIQMKYLKGKQ